MMGYFITAGDALSQLGNAVFFNSGNANESISGRSFRQQHKPFWGFMQKVVNTLFYPFEKDHCEQAYWNDVTRAQENCLKVHEKGYEA
jgi:hypothetical protein